MMTMTIEEIKKELETGKQVEAVFPEKTEDISDGFHSYKELYYQRAVLFAVICNNFPEKSWKAKCHEDGELCFGGGWFVVGVDTPEGGYTYHYEEKYWDLFRCAELPVAKHWDGHTEKDVTRLFSL